MSLVVYGLVGRQGFVGVSLLAEVGSEECKLVDPYEGKDDGLGSRELVRPMSSLPENWGFVATVPGSIPGIHFMPGDTTTGDTIFDSEENLEDDEAGRQPLFSSPDDTIAGWLEQDREGNYYISLQIQFFGQKYNVPLFVNSDRKKSHQIMNKAGSVLTEN